MIQNTMKAYFYTREYVCGVLNSESILCIQEPEKEIQKIKEMCLSKFRADLEKRNDLYDTDKAMTIKESRWIQESEFNELKYKKNMNIFDFRVF
jgi:hypothetical protein